MEAANTVLDDSTITSHQADTEKFQTGGWGFSAIQTAYGMGYKWDLQSIEMTLKQQLLVVSPHSLAPALGVSSDP